MNAMFNMCKDLKKKNAKIKIQCLTSRAQGPATRNQLLIIVSAEYCDSSERRISHLLMKKRHLLPVSNLLRCLGLLSGSGCSWLWHAASCCIWCPLHGKHLQAHKLFLFQVSAPYVSDTRVGNEAESYSARCEQNGEQGYTGGIAKQGVRSRQIVPTLPVGQRTSLLLLEIYPQTSYADE